MSLFKKFADYCRRANERDDAEWKRRSAASAAVDYAQKTRYEQRKCCKNCDYFLAGQDRCCRYSMNDVRISNPSQTACDEFSDRGY